jgi:hypothetical protein
MTNKGATVKLTEKQRETLDRLAAQLGQGYVGLTFVRPNTWRSLVAAELVRENVTHAGMFKLTEKGCEAAGVKGSYESSLRSAEQSARVEHLRRGNDTAMRTAEAAQLRDSQVLVHSHGNRHGVLGSELWPPTALMSEHTVLWTVDLDDPSRPPNWVYATPEAMTMLFAKAEGCPAATFMRRADSILVFRVLGGSDTQWGVFLQATTNPRYEMFRNWQELIEDGWLAVDAMGDTQGLVDDPRGRPKTPAELAEDARSFEQQRLEAAQRSRDPAIRAFYGVGDQVRQLDGTTAEVFEVVGETTVTVRTADGQEFEHEADELEPADAVPPMTLAQYTTHVAASTTPAHRVALGAGA